jgi:hypothetical protein
MFERLLKPYLTVETGEAYQPIRLTYQVFQKDQLITLLDSLKCCEKAATGNSWNWFWRDECADLRFQSIKSYKKNTTHPPRLGTFTIRGDILYVNLPSFKRACLVVPFLYEKAGPAVTKVHRADFLNKVFGIDERLPHGFSELFKEEELERIVVQRVHDYEEVQTSVEDAESAEEALAILKNYTQTEAKKRLPYAERYSFDETTRTDDPEVIFLGFFIFLRARELVAIRRWFGETEYSLADAAEEAVEKIFGKTDIDIIE